MIVVFAVNRIRVYPETENIKPYSRGTHPPTVRK